MHQVLGSASVQPVLHGGTCSCTELLCRFDRKCSACFALKTRRRTSGMIRQSANCKPAWT